MLHHYSTRENYLYSSCNCYRVVSRILSQKAAFPKKIMATGRSCRALCDAGMARLPASILNSKGHLSEENYVEVKNHPYYSYKMLKETKSVSDHVLNASLQHHEREDGSGYPLEVKGDKIHKVSVSRVIAVADVYHAMTSERYYRKNNLHIKLLIKCQKSNSENFTLKLFKYFYWNQSTFK
ncbi:HD-GYP domain-containing protein [Alteribacillus sp. JSM 102045]|uniref:HD-GYP domain-containing protein n=1 Tax=Alteribacillus sp. JSM 102045 TaxID=1562101 RepID=UPI0035BECC4B